MDDALFSVPAVHCFYGCPHVVRGVDPDANHAAMEAHYEAAHPDGYAKLLEAMYRRGA